MSNFHLSEGEDVSDLRALYSELPTDEESTKRACDALRAELEEEKTRRRQTFDELVRLQADAGTGGRMNQYRRLIGAGCGGLSPAEVDEVLGMLLETLEAEEPSASAITWSSKPTRTTVATSS